MVRQRKQVVIRSGNDANSSSSNSTEQVSRIGYKFLSVWKCIGVLSFCVAAYISVLGYLETRVNTPFDNDKIISESGLSVPDRYWGSYRPGVYFGMKSREPWSPVFGLMWYDPAGHSNKGLRHWCDQNDNLPTYGWVRHDGVSFGEQYIDDAPHIINTSFVKTEGGEHGGQWTARVEVRHKRNISNAFTLIWYAALDEKSDNSKLWLEKDTIFGYTPNLANFRLNLVTHKGNILHASSTEANAPGLHLLKEKVLSLLKPVKHNTLGKIAVLKQDRDVISQRDTNFVAIQLIVETPFILDIVYSNEDLPTPSIQGQVYTKALEAKRTEFDENFERKFGLKEKGYKEKEIEIAKSGLSNMVGGIGYFFGSSRVRSKFTKEPVPYWKAALYTAVPSRSFFPRGFLWDEGFHGLLISKWSPEIQLDITAHWLDLINIEGWIPREQILGTESLARVPQEFVVQSNDAGNPPMLLMTLAHMVARQPEFFKNGHARNVLDKMFTRLQAWYQWFLTSQRGIEPTSFRWRGRIDDDVQLNPKTLTSGLDDYPRSSHPSESERHVDLRCWMYAASDAMAKIANILNRDPTKYEDTRNQLSDEDLLNKLHWSPHTNTYADYGLHTDGARLTRVNVKNGKPGETKVIRTVTAAPKNTLVTSAFGYVSLFPMLLKVLRPDSPNLGKIFESLDNPELLWSPYGLRSLSKSSPLYMKRNTEHDPPYWRGQIWVNINYLCLSALKYYSTENGPYRVRAGQLHDRLRENLVGNIISEYKRSGYFWEQYSSESGKGSGCRPFTGWTALVVLIMAEDY